MKSNCPKYKTAIFFCSILALFHLCTVVLLLVITGGSGELQGWVIWLLDFPLVILLQAIPHGKTFLYGSALNYIFFFTIFGTAMYAMIGWWVGYIIYYMRRKLR